MSVPNPWFEVHCEAGPVRVEDINRIAVVGAGLMGHGIAQEFAVAGYEVGLTSRSRDSLDRAVERIRGNLEMLVDLGPVTSQMAEQAMSRLHPDPRLEGAVQEADLVVEAVYEDLALKQAVFRALDSTCPERTVLASTTSTFAPSELASATRRPEKVLVAHYINPPYLVPLVEIVPAKRTSSETLSTVRDLLSSIGKRPVVVRQEVPGFISVRLQMALAREALWLVQEGVASPEDVDTVIKTSLGRRWAVAGVFEVLELAGWDLVSTIASWLLPDLASSTELPPVLTDKLDRGELGVKTGSGFYDWTPESAEALRQRIAHALVEINRWPVPA